MDQGVKDLVKAITELQRERKNVGKVSEDLININSGLEALNVFLVDNNYSTPESLKKCKEETDRAFDVVYNTAKKAIKKLKELRKAQNYPIKKLMQALERIERDDSTNELKKDIRIQEIIEKRSLSLEKLCNRLVGLIKLKRNKARHSNIIIGFISVVHELRILLILTINYIIAELNSETEQIKAEISNLSDQIDKLKGE